MRGAKNGGTCHNFKHNVASDHVGKQSDREADGFGEKRNNFDRNKEGDNERGNIRRVENPKKLPTVPQKADDDHAQRNQACQGKGDNNVAGHGKPVREQPQEVSAQNKKKQRENVGAMFPFFSAHLLGYNAAHHFEKRFASRLFKGRNEFFFFCAPIQQETKSGRGEHHKKGGIRERNVPSAKRARNVAMNFELMQRG